MSEDDRVYLEDRLTRWRRASALDAASIFARLFTIFNILHVAIDAAWSGNANFKDAFLSSLIAAVVLGLLSMLFKSVPMFDE